MIMSMISTPYLNIVVTKTTRGGRSVGNVNDSAKRLLHNVSPCSRFPS